MRSGEFSGFLINARVREFHAADHGVNTRIVHPRNEAGGAASSLGEPRGPIYWCDKRCSEEAIRYWQTASMVGEEGGANTINMCQQFHSEKAAQQGKQRLKLWQWRGVVERKAHRGRIWKVMDNAQFLRGMWEYSTLERAGARTILADAVREKQGGIQGQRQQGSFFKEVLEQVKRSADADCGPQMMRRGYFAMRVAVGRIRKRRIQE